ncbi:MAG TPA: hypothetical protein PKA00_02960 [Saprospiraceae bacterium]|nr:hypothetical protein [Saprospiraceae bacterium]HMQ81834.1 hypothetical protein [Saprospiraceae bacterium]
MTKKNLRSAGQIAAAVVVAFFLSSCNRGYGCPSNFSLNENAFDVVNSLINILF